MRRIKMLDAHDVLLALRLALIVAPGYIHPDEFFQAQEVVAADLFGVDVQHAVPWEFRPGSAVRSIVPPFFSCGVPLLGLRAIAQIADTLGLHQIAEMLRSGRAALFAPRLMLLLASILCERAVRALCRLLATPQAQGQDQDKAAQAAEASEVADRGAFVYASSWVTLLMLPRPLSNSLEALALAAAVWVLVLPACPEAKYARARLVTDERAHAVVMGTIVGIGVFTRFTFAFFAAPVVLALLGGAFHRKSAYARRPVAGMAWPAPRDVMRRGLAFIVGCCAAGGAMTAVDSLYFGSVTFAPLANALYNLDPRNLRQHGLHPRFTHALVNMPMLFGPLPVLVVLAAARPTPPAAPVRAHQSGVKREEHASATPEFLHRIRVRNHVHRLLLAMVAAPLLCLSLAPHQEPRFLVPLIVPMAALAGAVPGVRRSRTVRLAWISFNIVALVFFAFVHQAGVVPALLQLNDGGAQRAKSFPAPLPQSVQALANVARQMRQQCPGNSGHSNCVSESVDIDDELPMEEHRGTFNGTAIFAHTYMPPRFVLAQRWTTVFGSTFRWRVLDNRGRGLAVLGARVRTLCARLAEDAQAKMRKGEKQLPTHPILVVAPATAHLEQRVAAALRAERESLGPGFSLSPVSRVTPHVSMEENAWVDAETHDHEKQLASGSLSTSNFGVASPGSAWQLFWHSLNLELVMYSVSCGTELPSSSPSSA